jgi:hypothetical protein
MDDGGASTEYVPFGSRPLAIEPRMQVPRRAGTKSSLLIAVLPLIALMADIFIFAASGESTSWTNLGAVTVATLAVSYGLARLDQRQLSALGLVVGTSPLIALFVPIAYLFVRGSRAWRETATGLTPAWLNVLAILIVGGIVYELPLGIAIVNGLASALHP